jgi:hypothetical protein
MTTHSCGVILSVAAFQAERRISRGRAFMHPRVPYYFAAFVAMFDSGGCPVQAPLERGF